MIQPQTTLQQAVKKNECDVSHHQEHNQHNRSRLCEFFPQCRHAKEVKQYKIHKKRASVKKQNFPYILEMHSVKFWFHKWVIS